MQVVANSRSIQSFSSSICFLKSKRSSSYLANVSMVSYRMIQPISVRCSLRIFIKLPGGSICPKQIAS